MTLLQYCLVMLKLDKSDFGLIQLFHDAFVVPHALLVLLLQSDGLESKITFILGSCVFLLSQRRIQRKIELLLDIQLLLFLLELRFELLLLLSFFSELLSCFNVYLDPQINLTDLCLSAPGVWLLVWDDGRFTEFVIRV